MSLECQKCVKSDRQIIKYFMNVFVCKLPTQHSKFKGSYVTHRAPVISLRVRYIASHFSQNTIYFVVSNRPVEAQCKIYFSFLRECAVHFNTGCFYCEKLYKKEICKKCRRKFRPRFSCVCLTSW
jgi:hypothetical protein